MTHGANPNGGSGAGTADSTSTSLLTRVRASDPDAWRRLVDVYGPLVYRWCRQAGLKAEDGADVTQEVFGAVATGLDDYRGGHVHGSFRAWLRTIARNKVYDHFRRRQRGPEAKGGTGAQQQLMQIPEPAEILPDGDPAMVEDSLWHRVLPGVRAEFEDHTWQAFWQVTIDGRRPADVAAELEMSTAAIYQAKSRVLHRLRQELSDLEADE
jgi:RNA polymerase sigma-70 factor, ECF subfamily